MVRQWSWNLALLLLIAVLVAIAFFRPGLEKPAKHPLLTALEPRQITTIGIQRPNHQFIRLQRINNNWHLTEPLKARASEFIVNDILRIAHSESLAQLPYSGQKDAAKYGFITPKATFTLGAAKIVFGDTNPLTHQQYVLFNNSLHMINANDFWSLTHETNEYIDRRLLEYQQSPVAIQFADGRELRQQNGSWVLQGGDSSKSSDELTKIVNEWRYLEALKTVPAVHPDSLGAIRIKYRAADSKKEFAVQLLIVSKEPELILYRTDEGLQYHFPADRIKQLVPAN